MAVYWTTYTRFLDAWSCSIYLYSSHPHRHGISCPVEFLVIPAKRMAFISYNHTIKHHTRQRNICGERRWHCTLLFHLDNNKATSSRIGDEAQGACLMIHLVSTDASIHSGIQEVNEAPVLRQANWENYIRCILCIHESAGKSAGWPVAEGCDRIRSGIHAEDTTFPSVTMIASWEASGSPCDVFARMAPESFVETAHSKTSAPYLISWENASN